MDCRLAAPARRRKSVHCLVPKSTWVATRDVRLAVLAMAARLFAAPCQAVVGVGPRRSRGACRSGWRRSCHRRLDRARGRRPGSVRAAARRCRETRSRGFCSCASASAMTTGSTASQANGRERLMRGGDAYFDASSGIPLLEYAARRAQRRRPCARRREPPLLARSGERDHYHGRHRGGPDPHPARRTRKILANRKAF